MSHIIELLSGFIIHFIEISGYFGVFILMTVESALIPVPSEITMPFAGYLVQKGELSFTLVVLAGAIGNVVGSWLAYGLGYYLEETIVLKLIKKYGKFLLISENEYGHSMHWLNKYGAIVAFFSRLLPGIRTFISLPAGLSEMNFWKFSIYTFLGSLIWSIFLTYIGVYFGQEWHSIEPYYRKFEFLIAGIMILGVLWYINHKLKIIKFKS